MMPNFEREVLDRLVRIEGKFDGLVELVSDIEHDLYGNGQPGALHDLTVVATRLDERTTSKAQTFAIPAGIAAFLYAGLEAVRKFFLEGGNG